MTPGDVPIYVVDDSTDADSTDVDSDNGSSGLHHLAAPTTLQSLDRKRMEAERLERLKQKRKCDAVEATVVQHMPLGVGDRPSSVCKRPRLDTSEREQACTHLPQARYLDGVVSLTSSSDDDPADGRIRFEDIFAPQGLTKVFLAAFDIDDEWLMRKLPRNLMVFIARQRPADHPANQHVVQISRNVTFVFPALGFQGYGCMHIKLFILWYRGFLRVVVGSANLVAHDWSIIENIVFVQDFVRWDAEATKTDDPEFLQDLRALLGDMNVPEPLRRELDDFNFGTAKGHLVASRPGTFKNEHIHKTGHMKLRAVAKKLGLALGDNLSDWVIRCQTSSLGALRESWVREMAESALGSENLDSPPGRLPISVHFPTKKSIVASGKQNHAGVLFFAPKYWTPVFPKHYMHNAESAASDRVMHSKIMLVCKSQDESSPKFTSGSAMLPNMPDLDPEDQPIGLYYLGSHSFTSAAWGTLTRPSRSDPSLRLTIRNWELGIVFPLVSGQSRARDDLVALPSPLKTPAEKYGRDDEPWSE
ncbi:tyrosyl-DNA phosphodiesterase-domain-containing protein [Polychytrium aggregatum]|uniref:tyrosyl-DNA phosphodiesterase-domain-containing protein n=1 Tax=Polychytrium aggregatum TaxID=110093 RepID=UPI0022FE7F31|nr:tyrosyl-DNA phosphodiesterase-domain-containing protein [Polychytrium aggregatum]KAI9197241.1 tyrosyl-DNA phosphodiesterase-domain-containing protein [Polychytrium aggregatum]